MMGAWIFRVAVGWTVWEMTRSPAMVGVATLCMLGPEMILAPVSGVLADRLDRRRLLALAHIGNGAMKLVTAGLLLAGLLPLWGLLALVALTTSISGVAQAAAKTIVSSMVDEHDLATAISLNSVLFNLAGFVGPAIAGGLLVGVGPAGAVAASGALSIAFVRALRRVPPIPLPKRRAASLFGDLAEGAAYVWRDPFIRSLCLLHMASATLARPFMEFIPALATNHLAGGAATVALLTSSVGFGSVLGGLWLAQRDNRNGVVRVVLAAFLALSLVTVAFVWTRIEVAAAGLALAAGFGMIVRAAGLQTLLQGEADRAFRGRVMAVYALILNGGSILGAVVIGVLAERIGLSWAFTLSVGAAMLVWLSLRPKLIAAAAIRTRPP